MIDLSIVTPTRNRWEHLRRQWSMLKPQLRRGDEWVIVIDDDTAPPWIVATGAKVVRVAYQHVSEGAVNRARNLGAALAERDYLVELDDHDFISSGALSLVRDAFAGGADYVFGDCGVRLAPQFGECGAELQPYHWDYRRGGFAAGVRPLGLRAVRGAVWRALGGWQVWPGGDYDFACRVERCGFRVHHVDAELSTIMVGEPESIMHGCRKKTTTLS